MRVHKLLLQDLSALYHSYSYTLLIIPYRRIPNRAARLCRIAVTSIHMATPAVETITHAGPKRSRSSESLRSGSSTPVPSVVNVKAPSDSVPLPKFLSQSLWGKLFNGFTQENVLESTWANRSPEINTKFEELHHRQMLRLQRANDGGSQYSQYPQDSNLRTIRSRNRYLDIYPWAASRIRLKVPEGSCDYINASPISLCCSKTGREYRYIAAQVTLTLFQAVAESQLGV